MIISFHPAITGNLMNCWDLMEILTKKYDHSIIGHYDPYFFSAEKPLSSVPEAGYKYYAEIANTGLPDKILVVGNCFGTLTAWESIRHLKKVGVNVLFCGINPAKWIFDKPRDVSWTDKYPSPLKEITRANVKSSEVYTPSPIDGIIPFFITSKALTIPNEWEGLCPRKKVVLVDGLAHNLTKYRFGGSAYFTASLIDEFIKLN